VTSATGTYKYNGDGLRTNKTVGTTTTNLAWDHAGGLPNVLTETAGTATTSYLYGPDGLPFEQIGPTGTVTYLHHDQLGSTRTITGSNGALVASATYDAYGTPTATTGTQSRLGYAGQYTDSETGLQYLRARYYEPATGQFLSIDPVLPLTRDAFGYASRRPLNMIDASGLSDGPPSSEEALEEQHDSEPVDDPEWWDTANPGLTEAEKEAARQSARGRPFIKEDLRSYKQKKKTNEKFGNADNPRRSSGGETHRKFSFGDWLPDWRPALPDPTLCSRQAATIGAFGTLLLITVVVLAI
jgi:RHS repeat-associated protein